MSSASQPGTAAEQQPSMNYCHYEGYLVSGDIQLFTDPTDYDVAGLPKLGCNRLRCPHCQAMVRNAPGLYFKDDLAKVNEAALYEVSDLAASPLLTTRSSTRLYLCRCMNWPQSIGASALGHPDQEPFSTPQVSWRCDGHPVAELPRNIDGVEVTPANVAEVATRSLRGYMPPGAAPEDKWGGYWVARLHARLARTPWQELVVAAAMACMGDPEPEARSRAMHFVFFREIPEGAQRAVALLAGDRALYAGVPDKATEMPNDKTLEHTLWRLAAPMVAQPGARASWRKRMR